MNNDLTIIPVINKIDLPNADVEKVTDELVNVLGFNRDEILLCSGKTGVGVKELLNAIVKRIPAPKEPIDHETKAMILILILIHIEVLLHPFVYLMEK